MISSVGVGAHQGKEVESGVLETLGTQNRVLVGGNGITAIAALHHEERQLKAKPSHHGPELFGKESD